MQVCTVAVDFNRDKSPDTARPEPATAVEQAGKPSLACSAAHFGRGILMGGADIIPGVSGGTVALILGIYERLVRAVSRVDGGLIRSALRFDWGAVARQLDFALLVPLMAGILTGVLTLSGVITFLLNNHLSPTFGAFFGLILGSTVLVARMVTRWTPGRIAAAVVGAGLAFWIVGLGFLQQPPGGPLYLFVCGAIGITAMILPGISGSYLLLVLGAYDDVLGLVNGFKASVKAFLQGPLDWIRTVSSGLQSGALVLGPVFEAAGFGLGLVIGILSFSKLLRYLLQHHRDLTLAVLTGLMLGSLRRLWPFQIDLSPEVEKFGHKQFQSIVPDLQTGETWLALACLLAGVVAVLLLDRLAGQRR